MTEIKNILLIGRSGRGKSALSNVLTNTNNFKESSSSTSETRKIQFGEFDSKQEDLEHLSDRLKQSNLNERDKQILQEILDEYIQNRELVKYRIIDTPGIGDTKLKDREVLDIIAEAVYLVRNGVSQVFFVTDGRFDQYEMATYNLLRTIIFDQNIVNYTTIVRTRFENFKKKDRCQEDIDLMVKETKEKKAELEKKKKEKNKLEEKNLSPNSYQYQSLLTEIEQLNRELTITNLGEIVESCQRRIIYVDNPPIEIKGVDEEELEDNKETRKKSRKKVLEHLQEICQENSYKPKNLQELSTEIADDYFDYLKKKEELEKELKRLKVNAMNSTKVKFSKTEDSEDGLNKNSSLVRKKEELAKNRQQSTSKTDNLAIGQKIAQSEEIRTKLKKEIEVKEQFIRQKVLKHIFNNYNEINNELGGKIFLDSVTGDDNWTIINEQFTNKEIVVKWLSEGFDYHQVYKWATVLGNNFSPRNDAGFCAWLRDDKHLSVEGVQELIYVYNIEELRQEYAQYLVQETDILGKHNQKLNWKETGDAQEWLDKNYPLTERNKIEELDISHKNLTGLLIIKDLPQLKKVNCYKNKLTSLCVSNCTNLTALSCRDNKLTNLDLSSCHGLTWLSCYGNQLTKLDLNCFRLTELYCQNNQLTELNLSNFSSLTELNCSNNQLTKLDLNNCTSLTELYCQNNQLITSLTEQLHDYAKRDEYKKIYYDYQAWLKDQSQLINSVQVFPK